MFVKYEQINDFVMIYKILEYKNTHSNGVFLFY